MSTMDTKDREKTPRSERQLDWFSRQVRTRKESMYDRVPLTEKYLTVIIRIVYVLLGIVAVLIILEATGVFKL